MASRLVSSRPIRSITYIPTSTPATEPVTTLVRSEKPVTTIPRPANSSASGQTLAKPASAEAEARGRRRRAGCRAWREQDGDEEDRHLDRRRREAGGDEAAPRHGRREQHVEPAAFRGAREAACDRAYRQVADRERHDQAQHLRVEVLLDRRQFADPEGFLQRAG